MSGPLVIAAAVDACERPVLARAGGLLEAALRDCGSEAVEVTVRFAGSVPALAAEPAPDFVVASLLPELASDEPVAEVEARWRAALAALPAAFPPALVCTVFRHVDPGLDPARREAVRERIRRLALAALEISHDTGVNVVDFDRTLAHVGARSLGSDGRFRSVAAIEVGARTLVRAMLAMARDERIAPDIATCAEARIGQPWDAPAAPRT